jgi:DNA polymerase alpha subunit A
MAEVKAIGQKLKAAVNKKYKCLEIEMDGYFRRMLLLKKKKYAALTVSEGDNGILKISRETKGLDLVRRDWCGLSHDICEYSFLFIA